MTTVKIPIVGDVNDTYTWLFEVAEWAQANCSSFQFDKIVSHAHCLEPLIVREPTNLHYTFTFADPRDAMMFAIKWL